MHEPEAESASAVKAGSFRERFLSADTHVSRFDRWVEFLSAIVLSLATVATAWCGYQAALWGGEQAVHTARSSAANVQSAQMSNQALQIMSLHANLFVVWAAAISEDNRKLSDFLYERFPPELKTATTAWLVTEPLQNPDAPASPFAMPEYVLPQNQEAKDLQAKALAESKLSQQANETSDRYILLTVIFASVLFFGGISGKFQSQTIDLAMLIVATIVFLSGLGIVLTYPVQ